jgi:hypothetical protein
MKLLGYVLLLFCLSVDARVLETQNYIIEIEKNCPEGYVTCDNVSYRGTHKSRDAEIKLKGETLHTLCADGVTPCRFLGYQFKNGNITYLVEDDAALTVMRNKSEILLREAGRWVDIHSESGPICNATRTVPLDMVPGSNEFVGAFSLVAKYDGKPCRDSILYIEVVETKSNVALFDTAISFQIMTMHDTYKNSELLRISYEKMNDILVQTATPWDEWPEFQVKAEKSADDYISDANKLVEKIESNQTFQGFELIYEGYLKNIDVRVEAFRARLKNASEQVRNQVRLEFSVFEKTVHKLTEWSSLPPIGVTEIILNKSYDGLEQSVQTEITSFLDKQSSASIQELQRLGAEIEEIWKKIPSLESEMTSSFEYAISYEQYKKLTASKTALFSFQYGEMAPQLFALNPESRKVVAVSAEAL